MKLGWAVEVAGTGASTPAHVVTNEDFARGLDTSDEWIMQRTGIRERRVAQPGETSLTFATAASRTALSSAGVTPADIDLILVATFTPDHILPATSYELQAALGCRWVPAFDLSAACSGFVYGLVTAAQYVVLGMARTALVVGVELLTRFTDMKDRATCVLFGDGAGAAVIRASQRPGAEILAARLGADGARAKLIWIPAGGTAEPATLRTLNEGRHHIKMQGREVYKFAVTQMQMLIHETLSDAGLTIADLALLIPHQSNLRIIESACQKAGVPPEKVLINIDRYGNTSAGSVPMALHEARRDGRIKPGDLVLLVAFGAGLSWASTLLRV